MEYIKKIISLHTLKQQVDRWHKQSKTIVFTNGCFDILHLGHLTYLQKAKNLGDKLIVGVNKDASVERIKGVNRPYNNEQTRAAMLAAFFFVDYVILFEEDTPRKIIKAINPSILVKGGDYKESEIVGADYVKEYSGKVIILPFLEGYSTTRIINKITK